MCARKYSQAYKQLSIRDEIARLISYNLEVAVCSRKHSTISKTLTYPNQVSGNQKRKQQYLVYVQLLAHFYTQPYLQACYYA